MQLTFLEAAVPLTKTITRRDDGSYKHGGWPQNEWQVTSHVEQVDDLAGFARALRAHADAGHCLLTGPLTQPIVKQSRKGFNDAAALRQWIVLDLDGLNTFASVDEFIMECLPEQFHKASYVMHHSASSGIKPGLRAHIFFMLYDEYPPKLINHWVRTLNLTTQRLSNEVTLSKNTLAISYPVDRVVNNNGRVVYIADPVCEGFNDPVDKRIDLVVKDHERVSFNFAAVGEAQVKVLERDRLDQLRAAAGLKTIPKNAELYRSKGEYDLVDDKYVEPATITNPAPDSEHVMRCDIGGGDSRAYFYYRKSPEILRNHKGEPHVKLRLLDPHYYEHVAIPDRDRLREKDNIPFVFRDASRDEYFVGMKKGDIIVVQPSKIGAGTRIDDYFMEKSNGSVAPPDPIETWDMVFDPTQNKQYDGQKKRFNTWRPTDLMANALPRSTMPPTIDKVIRHVVANDEECYHRLMNWIAFIFQHRRKAGTAWVLHGVPGTGKGVLMHHILTPLFGYDYCVTKQVRDFRDQFNGWMEQCILANVDEARASDAHGESKEIVNALKQWITEPRISIRHMRTVAVIKPSFINFLFTTNDFDALPIQDGDRRFNVAPRQERKIVLSPEEIVRNIPAELPHFAGYLAAYAVDAQAASIALENRAKQALRRSSESSIDGFVRALQDGNLRYFIEGTSEPTRLFEELRRYKEAVEVWIEDAKAGRETLVLKPDARDAFNVMHSDTAMKTQKFHSMMNKRFPAEDKLGWRVKWKLSQEDARDLKVHLSAVKTDAELEDDIRKELGIDVHKTS